MEWTNSSILALIFIIVSSFIFLLRRRTSTTNRLPPGPTGWPIVGNLFSLGSQPHQTLAAMRDPHGPVVWLRLGSINTMAILSAEAAADFFKNHDLSFCERTIIDLMRVHGYDKSSVALAPYGTHWRVLRKLLTVDIVVAKRLIETTHVRQRCIDAMLTWIDHAGQECAPGRGVHVAKYVFLMTFNLLGNLMLSRDLVDPNSEVTSELFSSVMGLMEWTGHANIVDLFPWLRRVDPQGLRRKMERDLGKALEIAGGFVRERLEERESGGGDKGRKKDFLDVLVEFEGVEKDEPNKLSLEQLNILILELFMAGGETTSGTTEWALTELLLNPDCLIKAKAELDQVVGSNRKVNETDTENHLPYLQAVVKETLRLHPPIPFLVPRRAMEDTEFKGYHIPKDTQVFVNTWAIGRDPDVWSDPLEFRPERFIGSKLDFKGQHYEFIPFGAGRRICAGIPLGQRMLHLVLGSLLHEFDWEFDSRVDAKNIDMRDRLGVTMRKFEPLLAVPKKRGDLI